MAADREQKESPVNQMMLKERRRLAHRSPSLTPLSHASNHFTLGSAVRARQATDTPLGTYVMHRAAEYKASRLSVPSPCELPQLVQERLSSLPSAKAKLGEVGGHFNSTSKTKCVPLPSIYDSNHGHVTRRGTRSITLHTERYTPLFRAENQTRTISDSLLDLTHSPHKGRQREHFIDREMRVLQSRLLQKEHEAKPHRQKRTFYMIGRNAKLSNRLDITPCELQELETKSFSQNTDLYYGKFKGNMSKQTTGPSKAVQKFKSQLNEARKKSRGEFGDFNVDTDGRTSGETSYPASPLQLPLEDTEGDSMSCGQEARRRSKETFMTQSKIVNRNDDSAERSDS